MLLKEEKDSDDRLRAQFRNKWTRIPSANLTAPMVQEFSKYRNVLEKAGNADIIVTKKLGDSRRDIEKLSKSTVSDNAG